eukprot:262656_1
MVNQWFLEFRETAQITLRIRMMHSMIARCLIDNYANIQMGESSGSGEDTNPVLVQCLIGNNPNANGFHTTSNAKYYNENKPFHHEGLGESGDYEHEHSLNTQVSTK